MVVQLPLHLRRPARNGFPDRLYSAQNTPLRSITSFSPCSSPTRSIPPPPAARSKSRWSHRPESRSGRTSVRPETTGVRCRRYAAACPAAAAVRAACDAPRACVLARHQARSLQRLLHPGVTQFDPMLVLQLLVKVRCTFRSKYFSWYKAQHFLHCRHRHPLRREGLPPAAGPATRCSPLRRAPATAACCRSLMPEDLPPLATRLSSSPWPVRLLPALSSPAPSRPSGKSLHALRMVAPILTASQKRTYHLPSQPDISCATDSSETTTAPDLFRTRGDAAFMSPRSSNRSAICERKRS